MNRWQQCARQWKLLEPLSRCLLLLLVLVICLGGLARFYRLDEKSLWSDEIATIATSLGHSIDPDAYRIRHESFDPPKPVPASVYRQKAFDPSRIQNLGSTADVLKANVHPPLFFTLMHLWLWNGDIDVSRLRVPAAVFGFLSLFLAAGVAYRLAQWETDWSRPQVYGFVVLSTALMAFSAYQIDHAQDARPYTLLLCFALLAVFHALKMARILAANEPVPIWRWLVLSVILAAGLYTQYFFIVFAGFVVLTLLWFGRRNPLAWGQLGGTVLLVLLLLSPWWPSFREQMAFLKQAGHYTAGLWNPVRLPEKLWRVGCEFFLPYSKVGKLIPLLVIALGVGSWLARRPWRHTVRWSPVLGFLLFWLLVLVGGQMVLDILKQTHTATIRRYLLLASPTCALLLSYSLISMLRQQKEKWLALALTAVMLCLMLGDSAELLFRHHSSSDEFKQAAAWINPNYQNSDLILVNKSGAMAVGMAAYLNPQAVLQGLDITSASALERSGLLMQGLRSVILHKNRVWLALSHHAPSTERRLTQWLTSQGFAEQEMRKFPGVNVLLWVRTKS